MIYFPFSIDYQMTAKKLSFSVVVENPDSKTKKTFRAILDTGATGSVITDEVFDSLKLVPTDRKEIIGENSKSVVPVSVVNITLPNELTFTECRVAVCGISGDVDVLIGMDIITRGDLAVSNWGQKTFLSYCAPSRESRIDFERMQAR